MTAGGGSFGNAPETELLRVNRLCNEFEAAWQTGAQPTIETVLQGLTAETRRAALRELLPLDIEYRRRAGATVAVDEYASRFPELSRAWLAGLIDGMPAMPEKLGDYKIVGRVGSGGMGTVYKAVHERMGRTVALKVLRAEKQSDPAWLQRFDREARAAARLSHPNIVAALDAREQDGVHFLITEFVDGIDLEAMVRRDGPLPVGLALDCLVQAARGLDYAHRQGVVHRDIKPANLLRDERGVVKVLDMGLARLDVPDDPAATELTKSGMVMGTAAYMAPEQARDTRRADARSDIYSLGCTLHYLLTGRPVFVAATVVDTIISHVNQPPPSLVTANGAADATLDAVFRRMVAKDPQERYQSAAEVIAALEPLLGQTAGSVAANDLPRMETARASAATVFDDGRAGPSAKLATTRRWLLAGVGLVGLAVGYLIVTAIGGGVDASLPADRCALEFNGHSSYVAVPDLVPVAGADFTLEAICRPRVFRTSNVISWLGPDWMALYLAADGQWGLARRFGDQPYLLIASEPAQLDKTVHLAGVFRGANMQLFVDGRLVETTAPQFSLPQTSGGLYIGGVAPDRLPPEQSDRFFHGAIAAVRISRGARYQRDFTPPSSLQLDADTIAVFPFEECSGTVVRSLDSPPWTGQIIDGTWQNAASNPGR